jgi:hypothetical protein
LAVQKDQWIDSDFRAIVKAPRSRMIFQQTNKMKNPWRFLVWIPTCTHIPTRFAQKWCEIVYVLRKDLSTLVLIIVFSSKLDEIQKFVQQLLWKAWGILHDLIRLSAALGRQDDTWDHGASERRNAEPEIAGHGRLKQAAGRHSQGVDLQWIRGRYQADRNPQDKIDNPSGWDVNNRI